MKTVIRLALVTLMMAIAAPAYSDSFSTFLKCEIDDDATPQALQAVASKWLKSAKGMKGGENLKVFLHFPVIAAMGETDFAFVLVAPSLAEWGVFMEGYEGSAAQKHDAEWDELASCPDSALMRSVQVK